MRSLKLLSVAGLLGFALGVAVPVLNTRGGCQNGLYTGGSCLPTETDAISTLEIRQASQIDQSGCQPGTYTCDWPVGVVAVSHPFSYFVCTSHVTKSKLYFI
jgi:hypothetical protein